MFMMLFILLSIPLGIFSGWFAWKAWHVGKMNVVWAMTLLSVVSFATAIIVGILAWLALHA